MSFIMKNIDYSHDQVNKVFNISDIDPILPVIEESLYRLLQMNAQVNQIINKLKKSDVMLNDSIVMDNLGYQDDNSINNLSSLKVLLSAIQDEVNFIANKGGIIQNIDDATVTWNGQVDGDKISYSWKLGEKNISYFQNTNKSKERIPLDKFNAEIA
jgi:hypothetical protein